MASERKAGHFTDLDGMRGVLACMIMLFHLGLNGMIVRITHGLLPGGLWTLSVDFFFILSGFVLYRSLERARPGLKAYFIKRVLRLAPMLWIGTLAMLALSHGAFSAVQIGKNLAMLQPLNGILHPSRLGLHALSIDPPAWSVPFELFLPALALPLLPRLARMTRTPVLVLSVVLALGVALCAVWLARGFDMQIARAACGLGLGFALGRLWAIEQPMASRPMLVLALFAGTIAIMALSLRLPWLAALFPVFAIGCIMLGAQTQTLLSAAPFQAIGRWSYSIYLLHFPILTLVGLTFGSAAGSIALKAVVVLVTVALSALTYRYVERPLMGGRETPAATAP
ncbi:MAG: acyltransferase 3 [Sphingomonas bacterium]|nr:acyltransferase 3 [Sphingomonas bacterium]